MLPAPIAAAATVMLALLGMVVGSFLNVVVWRLPRGESIVFPGSHCPRCGAPILANDNLPVFGWLLLAGRCRVCRGPISFRYPLVEALSGILTLVFLIHDGWTWLLPFHLAFAWMGLALALIDLDTFLLPFPLTLPLIPIAIASGYFDPTRGLARAAIGAGIGWALIVIVGKLAELMLGREAMGGGDAWLMASIGGFCGPLRMLVALFFASFQGALIGYVMIVARRRKQAQAPAPTPPPPVTESDTKNPGEEEEWVPDETAVPFGPFLILGAFEAILWGDAVLHLLRLDGWGF